MARADGISDDVMGPLALGYGEDVERVNDRLSEAVNLLRKGLRSEAIQRANMTPNVFDTAIALDFPELHEWLGILQFLGIRLPDQINQEYVQQINEAIVEAQPLETLLINHRKLAIAKAPLSWRLKVLRRIAVADSTNVVWEEDLERWEPVRVKQIAPELHAAISNRNINAVRQLHDELTLESWRIGLDSKLVAKAADALGQFDHEEKIKQLKDLAPKIHDAFSAFDEKIARKYRSEWDLVISETEMPVPSGLTDEVAPAMAWLSEMDGEAKLGAERQTAIAKLESVLDRNLPLAEIEKAYSRASRFDESVSLPLEQRYRSVVGDMELRSKRKTQLSALAIIGLVLLVASGIAYQQWRSYGAKQVADASAKLSAMLADGDWDAARDYVNQLSGTKPEVAGSPQIAGLVSQLVSSEQTETGRAQQFKSYLDQASDEDPAAIDASALNRAEQLALTEKEKGEVFRVKQRKQAWENEQKILQTDQALAAIKLQEKQLATIEQGEASAERVQALRTMVDQLDAISVKFPRRASTIDAQIQLVRNRAKSVREGMDSFMRGLAKRQISIRKVLETTTLSGLASSLEVLAADTSTVALSEEYRKSASELLSWNRALNTNVFTQLLEESIAGGVSAIEATAILAQLDKFESETDSNPLNVALAGLETRLQEITERDSRLQSFFEDIALDLMADLVTYEIKNNKDETIKTLRYFGYYQDYVDKKETYSKEGSIGFQVVVDTNGAIQKVAGEGPLTVHTEPRATFRWIQERYDDDREEFRSDWEGAFLKLMAQLIDRPKLDGLLKEKLLLQLLKGCADGSEELAKSLKGEIKILERRRDQRSEWYKPRQLSSDLAADVQTSVVPQLSRFYKERNDYWNQVKLHSQRRFKWIGVLLRSDSGEISERIIKPENPDGDVFVAHPLVGFNNITTLTHVGRWENEALQISGSNTALAAGRPLLHLPDVISGD